MKRIFSLVLLLAVTLPGSVDAQGTPASLAERTARAKQGTEQRQAHAASDQYHPYDTENREIRKTAFALLDQKKYPEAIAVAEKGLAKFPCDIELTLALAAGWRETGDKGKADRYAGTYMGLVDSILESGTGRDYASAFQVISVDEEYCVTRVLHLKVLGQALKYDEGHAYDVLTVKGEKTDEFPLYFNVDLPTRWMQKQFAAPAKK
jgi:hypothetical protein